MANENGEVQRVGSPTPPLILGLALTIPPADDDEGRGLMARALEIAEQQLVSHAAYEARKNEELELAWAKEARLAKAAEAKLTKVLK